MNPSPLAKSFDAAPNRNLAWHSNRNFARRSTGLLAWIIAAAIWTGGFGAIAVSQEMASSPPVEPSAAPQIDRSVNQPAGADAGEIRRDNPAIKIDQASQGERPGPPVSNGRLALTQPVLSYVAMLRSQMAEIVPENYRPVRLLDLRGFIRQDQPLDRTIDPDSLSTITEATHEVTVVGGRWMGRFTRLDIQHHRDVIDQAERLGRDAIYHCKLGSINVPVRGVWSADGAAAMIYQDDDGVYWLRGVATATQTNVSISWTIENQNEPRFAQRMLNLPAAPVNRLRIHVPSGFGVRGPRLVFEPEPPNDHWFGTAFQNSPATTTLVAALPANGQFSLRVESLSSEKRADQIVVRQNNVDYQFTSSGLLWTQRIIAEPSPGVRSFELESSHGRLTRVQIVALRHNASPIQPADRLPETSTQTRALSTNPVSRAQRDLATQLGGAQNAGFGIGGVEIPWRIRSINDRRRQVSTTTEFPAAVEIRCTGFLKWESPTDLPLAIFKGVDVIRTAGDDNIRLAIDRPLVITDLRTPDDWSVDSTRRDDGVLEMRANDLQTQFSSPTTPPARVFVTNNQSIDVTESWLRLQSGRQKCAASNRIFFECDQPSLDPIDLQIQNGWSVQSVRHVRVADEGEQTGDPNGDAGEASDQITQTTAFKTADYESANRRVIVWPSMDDWQLITTIDAPGFGVAGQGSDPASALSPRSTIDDLPFDGLSRRVATQRYQLALQIDGKLTINDGSKALPSTWFVRPRVGRQLAKKLVAIHPIMGHQMTDQCHQIFGRVSTRSWPEMCVAFLQADRDHALCIEPAGGVAPGVNFVANDVSFDVASQYEMRLSPAGQRFDLGGGDGRGLASDQFAGQASGSIVTRLDRQRLVSVDQSSIDREDLSREMVERYEIEVTSAGRSLDVLRVAEELASGVIDPASDADSDNPFGGIKAWKWYLAPRFDDGSTDDLEGPIQIPAEFIRREQVGTRVMTTLRCNDLDFRDCRIIGIRKQRITSPETLTDKLSFDSSKIGPVDSPRQALAVHHGRLILPSVTGATNQMCRATLQGDFTVTRYDDAIRLVPSEEEPSGVEENVYEVRYQADAPRTMIWNSTTSSKSLSIIDHLDVVSVVGVDGPWSMTLKIDATLRRGLQIDFDPRHVPQSITRNELPSTFQKSEGTILIPPRQSKDRYEIQFQNRASHFAPYWQNYLGIARRVELPSLRFDAPVLDRVDHFDAGGDAILWGNDDMDRDNAAPLRGQSIWVVSQTWTIAAMCLVAILFLAAGMAIFSWNSGVFWVSAITLGAWTMMSPSLWSVISAVVWLPLAAGAMLATGRRRSLVIDRTEHRIEAIRLPDQTPGTTDPNLNSASQEASIYQSVVRDDFAADSHWQSNDPSTKFQNASPPNQPGNAAQPGHAASRDHSNPRHSDKTDDHNDEMSWNHPIGSILLPIAIALTLCGGVAEAADAPVQVLVPIDSRGERVGEVVYVPRRLADAVYQSTAAINDVDNPSFRPDTPVRLPISSARYELNENQLRCDYRVRAIDLAMAENVFDDVTAGPLIGRVYRIKIDGNRVRSAQWMDAPKPDRQPAILDQTGTVADSDQSTVTDDRIANQQIRWALEFDTDPSSGDLLIEGLGELVSAAQDGFLQLSVELEKPIDLSQRPGSVSITIPRVAQSQLDVAIFGSAVQIDAETIQGTVTKDITRRGQSISLGGVDVLSAVIRRSERTEAVESSLQRSYFVAANKNDVSIMAQVQSSGPTNDASETSNIGSTRANEMSLILTGKRPTMTSNHWRLVDEDRFSDLRRRWRLVATVDNPGPLELLWHQAAPADARSKSVNDDPATQTGGDEPIDMPTIASPGGNDPAALLAYRCADAVSMTVSGDRPVEGLSVDQFRLQWFGEIGSIDRAVVVSNSLPTLSIRRALPPSVKAVAVHEFVVGPDGLDTDSTFTLIAGTNKPRPLSVCVPKSMNIVSVSLDGIRENPIRVRQRGQTRLQFGLRTIRPNTTISIRGHFSISSLAVAPEDPAMKTQDDFFDLQRPFVLDSSDTLERFSVLAVDTCDAQIWQDTTSDDAAAAAVSATADRPSEIDGSANRWMKVRRNQRVTETHLSRGVVPIASWSTRNDLFGRTNSKSKSPSCLISDRRLSLPRDGAGDSTDRVGGVIDADRATTFLAERTVTKIDAVRTGLTIDIRCMRLSPTDSPGSRVFSALVPADLIDDVSFGMVDRKVVLPAIESAYRLVRWSVPNGETGAKISVTVAPGDSGRIEVPPIRFVANSLARHHVILPPRPSGTAAVWLTEGLQPAKPPVIATLKPFRQPGDRIFDAIDRRWTVQWVPRGDQTGSTIVQSIDTRILPAVDRFFVHARLLVEPAARQQIQFSIAADARLIQTLVEDRPVEGTRLIDRDFPGAATTDRLYALPLCLTRLPQTVDVIYEIPRPADGREDPAATDPAAAAAVEPNRLGSDRLGSNQSGFHASIEISLGDVPVIRRWNSLMVSPSQKSFDGDEASLRGAAETVDQGRLLERRLSLASATVDAVETAMTELQIRSQDAARSWLGRRRDSYLFYRNGIDGGDQSGQDWLVGRCEILDQRMEALLDVFAMPLVVSGASIRTVLAAPNRQSRDAENQDAAGASISLMPNDLMRDFVIGQTDPEISRIRFPAIDRADQDGFLRWILIRLLVAIVVIGGLLTIGIPSMPPRRWVHHPAVWTGVFAVAGAGILPLPITLALVLVAAVLGYNTSRLAMPKIYRSAHTRRPI